MDVKPFGEGFLRLFLMMTLVMRGVVHGRAISNVEINEPCTLESCDCSPNNLKVICQNFHQVPASEPVLIRCNCGTFFLDAFRKPQLEEILKVQSDCQEHGYHQIDLQEYCVFFHVTEPLMHPVPYISEESNNVVVDDRNNEHGNISDTLQQADTNLLRPTRTLTKRNTGDHHRHHHKHKNMHQNENSENTHQDNHEQQLEDPEQLMTQTNHEDEIPQQSQNIQTLSTQIPETRDNNEDNANTPGQEVYHENHRQDYADNNQDTHQTHHENHHRHHNEGDETSVQVNHHDHDDSRDDTPTHHERNHQYHDENQDTSTQANHDDASKDDNSLQVYHNGQNHGQHHAENDVDQLRNVDRDDVPPQMHHEHHRQHHDDDDVVNFQQTSHGDSTDTMALHEEYRQHHHEDSENHDHMPTSSHHESYPHHGQSHKSEEGDELSTQAHHKVHHQHHAENYDAKTQAHDQKFEHDTSNEEQAQAHHEFNKPHHDNAPTVEHHEHHNQRNDQGESGTDMHTEARHDDHAASYGVETLGHQEAYGHHEKDSNNAPAKTHGSKQHHEQSENNVDMPIIQGHHHHVHTEDTKSSVHSDNGQNNEAMLTSDQNDDSDKTLLTQDGHQHYLKYDVDNDDRRDDVNSNGKQMQDLENHHHYAMQGHDENRNQDVKEGGHDLPTPAHDHKEYDSISTHHNSGHQHDDDRGTSGLQTDTHQENHRQHQHVDESDNGAPTPVHREYHQHHYNEDTDDVPMHSHEANQQPRHESEDLISVPTHYETQHRQHSEGGDDTTGQSHHGNQQHYENRDPILSHTHHENQHHHNSEDGDDIPIQIHHEENGADAADHENYQHEHHGENGHSLTQKQHHHQIQHNNEQTDEKPPTQTQGMPHQIYDEQNDFSPTQANHKMIHEHAHDHPSGSNADLHTNSHHSRHPNHHRAPHNSPLDTAADDGNMSKRMVTHARTVTTKEKTITISPTTAAPKDKVTKGPIHTTSEHKSQGAKSPTGENQITAQMHNNKTAIRDHNNALHHATHGSNHNKVTNHDDQRNEMHDHPDKSTTTESKNKDEEQTTNEAKPHNHHHRAKHHDLTTKRATTTKPTTSTPKVTTKAPKTPAKPTKKPATTNMVQTTEGKDPSNISSRAVVTEIPVVVIDIIPKENVISETGNDWEEESYKESYSEESREEDYDSNPEETSADHDIELLDDKNGISDSGSTEEYDDQHEDESEMEGRHDERFELDEEIGDADQESEIGVSESGVDNDEQAKDQIEEVSENVSDHQSNYGSEQEHVNDEDDRGQEEIQERLQENDDEEGAGYFEQGTTIEHEQYYGKQESIEEYEHNTGIVEDETEDTDSVLEESMSEYGRNQQQMESNTLNNDVGQMIEARLEESQVDIGAVITDEEDGSSEGEFDDKMHNGFIIDGKHYDSSVWVDLDDYLDRVSEQMIWKEQVYFTGQRPEYDEDEDQTNQVHAYEIAQEAQIRPIPVDVVTFEEASIAEFEHVDGLDNKRHSNSYYFSESNIQEQK